MALFRVLKPKLLLRAGPALKLNPASMLDQIAQGL